ncbi:uncharacterized protein LOC132715016 [Ruditapes philippinarum]|uniref:uncharacterized protein LOC132715016 n=1 Tax=Ruditapes philippinarum TaxID=129788 RepID=UPI00295AA113|nr:uncharacterized protein LOC132715016 [Ruditapes philippinarum]
MNNNTVKKSREKDDKKNTDKVNTLDKKTYEKNENQQTHASSHTSQSCVIIGGTQTKPLFVPIRADWQRNAALHYNLNGKISFDRNFISQELDAPSRIQPIIGDGNCFFRCISYIVSGWEKHFHFFRSKLIQHMQLISQLCTPLLNRNEDVDQYIARTKMATNNTWATQTEIFVMSHLLKTDIFIYTNSGNNYQWLRHSGQFLDRNMVVHNQCIYLNHHNRNHYEVVLEVAKNSIPENFQKETIYKELQNQSNKAQQHLQSGTQTLIYTEQKTNIDIENCDKQTNISKQEKNRLKVLKWRNQGNNRKEENKRKRNNSTNRGRKRNKTKEKKLTRSKR